MTAPMPALPDPDDLYDDHPDPQAEYEMLAAVAVANRTGSLEAALAEAPDDVWRIRDDMAADWAMRKLAEAQAHIDQLDRQHLEYVTRADQWRQRVIAGPRRDVEFFTAHLAVYAQQVRSQSGGKVKTLRLPSGEVPTRTGSAPRPTIEDPQAVLQWALDQRDRGRTGLVRSRLVLDVLLTALAPHVEVYGDVVVDKVTGEVVPGTGVTQTPPSATPRPYES